MVKHLTCYLTHDEQKILTLADLKLQDYLKLGHYHHVFVTEAINTKTTLFGIGLHQIGGSKSISIYSHTFSGNVAGHSMHKSILFWSVKLQKEVTVNSINQFRWDLLCLALGLRRWTWFSLPLFLIRSTLSSIEA